MTTGVLSLETETLASFWVVTIHIPGGGSEVFAIVLRFGDRTNNAPRLFYLVVQGWALGTKSANPHSIVLPPQSVDNEHK